MADIKIQIKLEDIVEGKVNKIYSTNETSNASIQTTSGFFNSISKKNDGIEMKSWANESLSLADGYVGGASTQLVEQYGYNGYVFGAVPESKQLSVTIEVVGENIDSIIVYGDNKANQFPTKAYRDGNPNDIIYSDDPVWAIKFNQQSDSHTITFLEWNRANYNACITSVVKFSNSLFLGNSEIKSVEQTKQSTSEPDRLQYSALSSVGNLSIIDKNLEFHDLVKDNVLDFSKSEIELFINEKTIDSFVVDVDSLSVGYNNIKLNTTDSVIPQLNKYVIDNISLYGWNAINLSDSSSGESLSSCSVGSVKGKTLYQILYHSFFHYLYKKKKEKFGIHNDRTYYLLSFGGMSHNLIGGYSAIFNQQNANIGTGIMGFKSDIPASVALNHKYFISFKARGSGNFGFGVDGGTLKSFTLSDEFELYQFFYTPTSNPSNEKLLFIYSSSSYASIEIADCIILDLTNLGFENETLEWCSENFVIFSQVENALDGKIIGLDLSVREYLSKYYTGIFDFDGISFNEILNKICEIAQLQIIEKNGQLVFVNGRPRVTNEEKIISIPLNAQFGIPQNNLFLSNKYDSAEIDDESFSIENKYAPADLSLFKNFSIVNFNTNLDGLYYVDGWQRHNTYTAFIFKKFSVVKSSGYRYFDPTETQIYAIYQGGQLISNGEIKVYSSFNDVVKHTHEKNQVIVIGRDDFYNHECVYLVYSPSDNIEVYIGGRCSALKGQKNKKTFFNENSKRTKSINIPSNHFFQSNSIVDNVSFAQNIANNIYLDYKDGLKTLEISVGCLDYYNIDGEVEKKIENGDLLEVGDCVRVDKDNLGTSRFSYSDGSDIFWRIVGRTFRYQGCPFLDLTLQEIKK